MSADTDFEARLRTDLRMALDQAEGPHRDWATSPAASRIAAAPSDARRPWRAMRLLAVAAVLTAGAAGAMLLIGRDPEDVGRPGCPTLRDYAEASAAPAGPFDQAPTVSFPPVAPTATMTTGVVPLGTWIVVADDEGPAYQIRLRDARPCDRLPDLRSSFTGGRLMLAQADIQQLRPRAIRAWTGMTERFIVAFGDPAAGSIAPVSAFGVPGIPPGSTISPRDDFAQTSLVIFDLPDVTARMTALLLPEDGTSELSVGWVLRDGSAVLDDDFGHVPQPGPTDTTGGPVPLDAAATTRDPATGAVATVVAGSVDEVEGYPDAVPTAGGVFVEVLVSGYAWSSGRDPSERPPDETPEGLRWVATDASGGVLVNLGDLPETSRPRRTISPLRPSDFVAHGFLVYDAPRSDAIRLALTRHGAEIAWWSLRD